MKKKILILLTFLFCAIVSFAQFVNDPSGTPQQIHQFRGAVTGLRGIMITPNDTTNNPATPYFGALTVLPTDAGLADIPIWMSNGIYWIRFTGGSATNINDTIYTRIPIRVDTTTFPGHRILYLLHADGIESPGYVIWTGVGLNFNVTPSVYDIGFRQFNSPFALVTLATASAFTRKDLFIVDTNALASALTGQAGGTTPQTNPSSQLPLTDLTINPGDTVPAGVQLITLYNENLGNPNEFQTGTVAPVTVNYDNTDNPYIGAKAAFVSSYQNGGQLTFTSTSVDTVQAGEILRGFIWFNIPFVGRQLQFQYFNGSTAVSNAIAVSSGFGINPNNTGVYQIFAIPLNIFTFTQTAGAYSFDKLVITMAGEDTSGGGGFYIDYLQLQTGIINVNPTLTLTTNGSSGAATLINNILNIPIYSGGGTGTDSSAYHTITQLTDSSFTINDLLGRTDTVQIITGSGGGGGGGVGGSGTADYVARWLNSSTLTTGLLQDNANRVTLAGTLTPVSDTTRGLIINPTLTSTGNNQTEIALDLTPVLQNSNSGLNTVTISAAGTLYTDGTYTNVPIHQGAEVSALATVVVSGGAVTSVTITTRGTNYVENSSLTITASDIGGTGSGFTGSVFSAGYTGLNKIAIRQTTGSNYFNQTNSNGFSYFGTTSTSLNAQSPSNTGVVNASMAAFLTPIVANSGGSLTKLGFMGFGLADAANTYYGANVKNGYIGSDGSKLVLGMGASTGGIELYVNTSRQTPAIKIYPSSNTFIGAVAPTDTDDRLQVNGGRTLMTSQPVLNSTLNIATNALVITSTNQGLLPPRVTQAQRDGFQRVSLAVVNTRGTGYTSDPAVGFSGGGGSGATATAVRYFNITSVNIVSGGSGYSSTPSVVANNNVAGFSGAGTPTVVAGVITAVTFPTSALFTVGTGITITVSGGGGSGANITVNTTDGVLGEVTITSGGITYGTVPAIAITGGGGSGATATATISILPAGTTVFCSDCTATNGHTGVMQTWSSSATVWENFY